MPDSIRLTSPAEFAAAVPSLIGFRPSESVVVVYLEADSSHIVCTLRVDVPDDIPDLAKQLLDVGLRARSLEALIAVYTAIDATERVLGLVDALDTGGLHVRDALLVHADRFRSYLCTDDSCCTPEGTPIPANMSQIEVEHVAHGHRARAPSRADVTARFAPRPDLAPSAEEYRHAAGLANHPLRVRCDTAWKALTTLVAAARHPPTGAADVIEAESTVRAGMLVLLCDIQVRDHLLATVATQDAAARIELADAMVSLALTAPEGVRRHVAATAAALLAITGHSPVGARELVALADRESLAQLVESSLDLGIHPDDIREVFLEALPEIERRIADSDSAA